MQIKKCPITGNTDNVDFLDLGMIPIEGNLTNTLNESILAARYPMTLQFFSESKLVSLTSYIDPTLIYDNYLYHSGVSKPYVNHCAQLVDYLKPFVHIKDGDVIMDIGGNDGTLLKQFKKIYEGKLLYMNVEASKSFLEKNKEAGLAYFNAFFGENFTLGQKAKIITSTNVFQHTEPIVSFVKGIKKNLAKDGVWSLEFPYFLSSLMKNCYDQAYHEHIYYYFLTPLKILFEKHGLRIINVSYHEIHDGTLRVLIVKKNSTKKCDGTVDSFLALEKDFTTEDYLFKWGLKIKSNIGIYKDFINELKDSGATIAGFGAAIKGCVFLNSCGLTYKEIDYIIDDTPEKQNKFIPGTGIQVVSREILNSQKHPEYILILAHNFKEWIVKSLRESGYDGKFIVMFPDVQIIA